MIGRDWATKFFRSYLVYMTLDRPIEHWLGEGGTLLVSLKGEKTPTELYKKGMDRRAHADVIW